MLEDSPCNHCWLQHGRMCRNQVRKGMGSTHPQRCCFCPKGDGSIRESLCSSGGRHTPVPSSHLLPLADKDEVFLLLLAQHVAVSPGLQEGGALEGQERILALFRWAVLHVLLQGGICGQNGTFPSWQSYWDGDRLSQHESVRALALKGKKTLAYNTQS